MLAIDEVSMVNQRHLLAIHESRRQLRQSNDKEALPFGGISVIFIGDPYQIAPVVGKSLMSVRPTDLREAKVVASSSYSSFTHSPRT